MKKIISNTLIALAVIGFFPLSAVAEPSAGMFGAESINAQVSAIASKVVPRIVIERYQASVTAYNPEAGQTDDTPHTMANNNTVNEAAAACSREIPFYAELTITLKNGKKLYKVCEDRMAQKYDHATNLSLSMPHFDILMFDKTAAKQFGRQIAMVEVKYEAR